MPAALKHLLLAVILAGIFPAASVAQSAVQRTLAWDPTEDAARVTEYRIERNFVFLGSTTQLTFPVSILPGERVTFVVRSFGWCQDILTGGFFGCEGPLSDPLTYTEPVVVQPAVASPPSSADGATCQIGTGCSLIDTGLNVWTLDGNGAILRNGQHWNEGYSEGLLWFAGEIYAYWSHTNAWWVDSASGWASVAHDPRLVPSANGAACQVGTGCILIDAG